MSLRVLVADDQPLVRAGLRTLLEAEEDLTVVAEAPDGRAAVTLARALRPDVCLLDLRMPGLDGIEATSLLAGPGVADPLPVVIITTFDLDEHVYAALRAGARGFLLKDVGAALLAESVRAAASGDALLAPAVTARLLARFAGLGAAPRAPRAPLTEREDEVLRALARGLTNQELARALRVSLSTIKTHVASLMEKLDARNRVELALWAYESGRVAR